MGASPSETLGDGEFQRLKYQDFRRPTLSLSGACAVLVFSLWLWDWAIDPVHAPDTFWLRLLLAASILVYPLAIIVGARRLLAPLFYTMLLWLQVVFVLILDRLEGGAVHGMAGFMFWFIVPPLMAFILPLRGNVMGNLAVAAFPNLLFGAFGLLPAMDLRKLDALIIPACGITLVGHLMVDRLLRRIYEYRWQLEWHSAAIDALAEGIVIIQDKLIRYANLAASTLIGRTPAQMVGLPLDAFVRNDAMTDLTQPLRFEAPDGRVRWLLVGRSAIAWRGKPAILVSIVDVTEQRRADEALRDSERRYREVVDNVSEGILVVQDERFVFANPSALRLTGYAWTEIRDQPFAAFVHADDLAQVAERYQRRIGGEALEARYEFRVTHRDGTPLWAQLCGVVIDWNGRPATLYFISDIDKRKQAEAALMASEERYRLLVDHASEGIVISQKGILRFVNPRIEQMAGRDAGELLGQPLLHFVHADDHAQLVERYRRRQRGETVPTHELFRLMRPDGRIAWIEFSGVDVEWEREPAVLSFLIDVTERHRLEEGLKQTLAERETILERSMAGIAFLDPKGRLRWANSAMGRVFGMPMDDIIGHSLEPYYPSREAYLETGAAVSAAVLAGEAYECELRMCRADGTPFWAHLSGKAVNPDDLARGTVWVVMDIDQRKQAEEEIRNALERQKELNLLKSRFVSMTSHEFRTPLAAIHSSAELLKYYGDRLPASEKSELVDNIMKAVRRMTRMLDDVLVIGKAESDRLEFNPAPLDVGKFCRAVVDEAVCAERGEGRSGDRIVLALPPREIRAELDEKLVRFILGNLLSNGLKSSPQGGEVRLEVEDGPQSLRFAVIDHGIGIPENELGALFEPFHRAKNVGTLPGTGLGLAIVRKAVDLHGGQIEVCSAPGAGSRFTVTLPRLKS